MNELNEAARTVRTTQISRRQLLGGHSTTRAKPVAADGMRQSAMSEDDVTRLTNLRNVAISQTLLHVLGQWHLAAHALQVTIRRLAQNVATFGAMEFHGTP